MRSVVLGWHDVHLNIKVIIIQPFHDKVVTLGACRRAKFVVAFLLSRPVGTAPPVKRDVLVLSVLAFPRL